VRLFVDYGADRVDLHALYTNRKTLPAKARVFIDAVAGYLSDLRKHLNLEP